MSEYKCPACSYPIGGISCPNCKKVFPTGQLKVVPAKPKTKKKPVVN